MMAWLQTARGLGQEQYNECVQLAVSLLMRRNAGKVRALTVHARSACFHHSWTAQTCAADVQRSDPGSSLTQRPSLAAMLGEMTPSVPSHPCESSGQPMRRPHVPAPPMPMLTLRDLEADVRPPCSHRNPCAYHTWLVAGSVS